MSRINSPSNSPLNPQNSKNDASDAPVEALQRRRRESSVPQKSLRQMTIVQASLKKSQPELLEAQIEIDEEAISQSKSNARQKRAEVRRQEVRDFFASAKKMAEADISTSTPPSETAHTDTETRQDAAPDRWPVGSPPADLEWSEATDILERASLLQRLFEALYNGDWIAIQDGLAEIPQEVEHFDRFFPVPPIGLRYPLLAKFAELYHQQANTPASQRLLALIQDSQLRLDAQFQVAADQQALPTDHLKRAYPTEIVDLCLALRDTPESELSAQAPRLEKLIQRALPTPHLTAALAMQPYANLRMLRLKCTVLKTHLPQALAERLLNNVQQAQTVQTNASAGLREQLLQRKPIWKNVARLAMLEYAKQKTSAPIDHVSAGATLEQLHVLNLHIQRAFGYYSERDTGNLGVELAALRWVMDQIHRTHNNRTHIQRMDIEDS